MLAFYTKLLKDYTIMIIVNIIFQYYSFSDVILIYYHTRNYEYLYNYACRMYNTIHYH